MPCRGSSGLQPGRTIITHGTEASLLAQPIKLINEEDAGGIVTCPLEHVPHPGRSNAHKHLHELSPCCCEERHPSFTSYGLCQQGLACIQSSEVLLHLTPLQFTPMQHDHLLCLVGVSDLNLMCAKGFMLSSRGIGESSFNSKGSFLVGCALSATISRITDTRSLSRGTSTRHVLC